MAPKQQNRKDHSRGIRFFPLFIQLSGIEIRSVFFHAKFMISSLQRLAKIWGAHIIAFSHSNS